MYLLCIKNYNIYIKKFLYEKHGKCIIKMPYANTIKVKGGLRMDKKELWEKAGSELRNLRKGTGLSVFKVGRAIGVSGSYISQFERGSCAPSEPTLIALGQLYGVDQKQLFSLYNRLPNDEIDVIMQYPELRQLFIDVTKDKNFNPEKMSKVIEEFKTMAKEYYNKGD